MDLIITTILVLAIAVATLIAKQWFDLKEKKQLKQRTEELEQTYQESIANKTRLDQANENIEILTAKVDALELEKAKAKEHQFLAEKETALAKQEAETAQKRIKDWESLKEESFKSAREAMFMSGSDLLKKETTPLFEKTQKSMQTVLQTLTSLSDRMSSNEATVDTLFKALSTPQAVGQFSEIGLENTLKSFGLEAGKDFVMQYAIKQTGSSLRPDAVVFLPAGHIMVIDSKASQFFLQHAAAEGTDEEEQVLEQLKKTMHDHIKSLASKAYNDAVKDYIKEAHYQQKVQHAFTIMYVFSETNIEKIYKADPEIAQRALKSNIILSGPTGLASAMSLARFEIRREQQSEHQEVIIDEVRNLLGSVEIMINHALKVGKGIESAANNFKKFASSINSNLLPKARKLNKLGVELPKNKHLPSNVPTYHVSTEELPLIEGEMIEEKQALESKEE